MSPVHVAILALQVSILGTVFGFGLSATRADLMYVIRRPRLLVRSLVAMFVLMPMVALTLAAFFDFPREVDIILIALAISPVPPLLPTKEAKAGGDGSYGLGLMALLALLSIVVVPLSLEILQRIVARPLGISLWVVASVMIKVTIAPLAAGVIVRALLPRIAVRLERVISRAARWLMTSAAIALIVLVAAALWVELTPGTLLALVIFTLAGLAIGHVLGGPVPDEATVLALSTASRHPALALTIAATNYSSRHFAAIVLLYLLVSAIIGFPYLYWRRRKTAS